MSDLRRPITRREALRTGVALGAGAALAPGALAACSPFGWSAQAGLLTKPIPSTSERIPVIGIGTSRDYDVETDAERAELREVLRELPRLGGSVIDTAPNYGAAETVIGDLVAEIGNRNELFLATKVGVGDEGRDAGVAEIERSFERLRMDQLDLLQIHNLRGWQEMLPILLELKEEGRIRYVGITTWSKDQYDELAGVMRSEPLDFVQVDYAVDNRSAEDMLLPLAADQGIAVLINVPFGGGQFFEVFGERQVPEWAAEWGIESWAQFALKFVVSHPAVTCAIPGTAIMEFLTDNLGAARGALPDEATRERMATLVETA